jgi:farnesyl-diphosphate farnesyltransferase
MSIHTQVLRVLEETSRTFYIPVARMPDKLRETVAAAYLCMRALDEIEDHPDLDNETKVKLLHNLSQILQTKTSTEDCPLDDLAHAFLEHKAKLPEVTLRFGEWACYAPAAISPRIWDAAATMADRMAQWVSRNWKIHTRADLDGYTFSVAGSVGLLLCDVWAWFDGGQIDRRFAVQFGRGLQAVNILRNREEDLKRDVDFFPTGWSREQMIDYASYNLSRARIEGRSIPLLAFKHLVEIPLLLAEATLEVIKRGEEKLSRSAVLQIVQQSRLDAID